MLHAPVEWKRADWGAGEGDGNSMGYWAPQLQVMETPEPEERWKWVSTPTVHPKRGVLKQPLAWVPWDRDTSVRCSNQLEEKSTEQGLSEQEAAVLITHQSIWEA